MAITIPSVTYNSRFGNINKCVWFETVDNYNYFSMDLVIEKSQIKETSLVLLEDSGLQKWSKVFPKSIGTDPYLFTAKILQVPNSDSINYVLQNNAI